MASIRRSCRSSSNIQLAVGQVHHELQEQQQHHSCGGVVPHASPAALLLGQAAGFSCRAGIRAFIRMAGVVVVAVSVWWWWR